MMSVNKAVGIILVLVVFCAWAYIALTGEPQLQIGIANGRYSNRCCGTVALTNGVMTVENQHVGYVIEQDKAGPYVLPKAYVGASDHGFVIRSDGHALKLRLDDPAHPHQVELLDDTADGEAYPFPRVNGS